MVFGGPYILVFVHKTYLFCAWRICRVMESRNQINNITCVAKYEYGERVLQTLNMSRERFNVIQKKYEWV